MQARRTLGGLTGVLMALCTLEPIIGVSARAAETEIDAERLTFMVRGLGTSRSQETRFDFSRGQHRIVLGAQYSKYKAASPLANTFEGAYHTYEAGEVINTRIKKTWYELNYLARLKDQRLLNRPLQLSLGGGLAVLNFDYRVGSSRELATQTHSDLGYRVGGEALWRVGQRLSLSGLMYLPVPVAGAPAITSLELTTSYQLWQLQNTRWNLLAGAAYHHVDHSKRLPSPEHVRLMTGPLLRLGMELSF